MKRFSLLLLFLFIFSIPIFCETDIEKGKKQEIKEVYKLKKSNIYKSIFVHSQGKSKKSLYNDKKLLKEATILDAKRNLLSNVCKIFIDKETLEKNYNNLYTEIINSDRYIYDYEIINTYENTDYYEIILECEINLNSIYSKIKSLNLKASKPKIFIYGASDNNIQTNNIIETEFAKKIKDLGFEPIDRISLGVKNINDKDFATNLLKSNVKTNIIINCSTEFSQEENGFRSLITESLDIYFRDKARKNRKRVNENDREMVNSMREISLDLVATTNTNVTLIDIYSLRSYGNFNSQGIAKGTNTLDLANGLAQNSIITSFNNGFNDYYKSFTNSLFNKILSRINLNIYYLKINNIKTEDLQNIQNKINSKIIKYSINNNYGFFLLYSEEDIFTLSEKIDKISLNDKKINVLSFEDNIIECNIL